jgi:sialidase-1
MQEHIYDLSHGVGNPRNSEGSFVLLNDGRILFVYTRYNGESWSDHASADLAAIVSDDDGCTWQEIGIIRKNDAANIMSVSLLRLQDGRIALLYLRKKVLSAQHFDCRPWICFSSDEGASWSEAKDITGLPPLYLVVNNDRLVQLRTGRLLLPAALHRFQIGGQDPRSIAIFFISDDGGETWRESKEWVLPPSKTDNGFQEPGVCECQDGKILAYFRSSDGAQYEASSQDNGESWSEACLSQHFPSPLAPLSMKLNPKSGELFAIWCDRDPRWQIDALAESWGRTPLVMARSKDNGHSWYGHRLLEAKADHGYCYTAMFFTEEALLLAYCCGGGKDSQVLQDLRIRRVPLESI